MAKYSDIKGFTVQTLSSDTVASRAGGGSWSSGGDLNTARSYLVGVGISTAALAAGGYTGSYTGKTESYNGTSWTETTDLNTSRGSGGGAGTYTASIYFGGSDPTTGKTESWNGSSWTEVNDLNDARTSMMGAGTQTAAISAGGSMSPAASQLQTETWNGSSWTEVADLPTTMLSLTGGGSSTSAIACTGQENPPDSGMKAHSFSWNGSAWTSTPNVNTARYQASGTGFQPGSSNTDVMIYGGGTPPVTAKTEFWDGSSWTEIGDMGTARGQQMAGNGTSNDAIAAGGIAPGYSAATEEWTAPATFTKQIEGQLFFNSTANAFKETITDLGAGAWASGANINTAREGTSGAGDSAEAALLVGGYTTSAPTVRVANVESWDGSSWTEVNDLNSARYLLASSGTNTAALAYGGNTPPPAVTAVTESWNGSSWTEVNDLNTARQSLAGVGPYTSALAFGGTTPTKVAVTETWDGTNWTEVADLNTARGLQASVGVTQTAALSVSGNFPQATQVEEWDGTSWTEIAEVNTARYEASGSGSSTIGLIFGGRILGGSPPAAYSALTESWNGTAWTERADLATARGDGASANNISNNSKALYFSGSNPPYVYTEEWTAPLANKTITAS
jgi:hypothetical protein